MTRGLRAVALLAVLLASPAAASADADVVPPRTASSAPEPPAPPQPSPSSTSPSTPTLAPTPPPPDTAPPAPPSSPPPSSPPPVPPEQPRSNETAPPTEAPRKPPPPPPTTLPPATRSVGIGFLERHRGKQLTWDPAFNRMDAPEIVLTSIAAAVAVAGAVAPPLKTHWRGGFLADNAVRNALRLPSYQARLDARDVSDVGLAMITTIPILVDSVIVAYWYRGSDDVALQMGLIDAEAIAVSAAIQGAGNFFGGRERPYGVDCGTQLSNHTIDCQSTSRYRSFFSGHSTLSFTSASLICAHHLSLDLFENAADPAMCASAFVAAAAISTLRIAGDMHYLSDVLAGAVVGTAVGLGIPLLHHYRRAGPATASQLQMHVLPSWGGAQLVGSF